MSATITRFLTPEEVSTEIFGGAVAPDRIVKLSKHQGLPSHRVGRRRMYLAAEVAAWARDRDGDGDTNPAAEVTTPPAACADAAATTGDSDWLAATLARFSPDDLRRVAQVLRSVADDHARELTGGAA